MSGIINLGQIFSFVREHHAFARTWKPDDLNYWIGWHLERGLLSVISDDLINISGLIAARPVMRPQDAFEPYLFDYEGSCLYVDMVIAKQAHSLKALVLCALHRFGMRPSVAWNTRRNKKRLVVRPGESTFFRFLNEPYYASTDAS